MKKKALITGISGQDGSYLAEFLLKKKYEVHGIIRKSSNFNTKRIDHIFQDIYKKKKKFYLHYGDLTDSNSIISLIKKIKPDEIYNLAAQSHVKVSFELPEYTSNVNSLGVIRILDAIKILNLSNKIKFYQASSSEMFGEVVEEPQTEKTRFNPKSPYAISKLFAYWICKNYREAYNMHISNGILFNHESPRRGGTFVTKKIVSGVVKIIYGKQDIIYLGNIYSERDWGHAKDYIRAKYMILQRKKADDYVISTGQKTTVKNFLIKCFNYFGVEIYFKGKGLHEKGYVRKCTNKKYIIKKNKCILKISQKYFRPTEVDKLLGDSSKALKILKWKPEFNLDDLIKDMIEFEIKNSN